MDEKNLLRVIPIHKSLVRPQLIVGCERFLFLMLCMVVTLLVGPGGIMSGNMTNILLGTGIFFTGRAILVYMAKIDPSMSTIFRRSVLYKSEYPACSTVNYWRIPKAKRW